jgi:hypothetical protein
MHDKINSLARKLIRAEDPEEFRPVAAELRREIHECVRQVQLKAIRMVLRSRLSLAQPLTPAPSKEINP